MQNTETQILKVTEKMIREGGYNSFSFRDIAAAVGIKSSSVHYHYPTKATLSAAVAVYYTNKTMDHLGPPDLLIQKGEDPIDIYIKLFRKALTTDKRMCMFGMLGSEVKDLPNEVVVQIKIFFERNIEWLTEAYTLKDSIGDAKTKAISTIALLEGALIVSNVLGDIKAFDQAAVLIRENI